MKSRVEINLQSRFPHARPHLVSAFLAFCSLVFVASFSQGAGVTVITHGYWSDADPGGWVAAMAGQIASRTGEANRVTRIMVNITGAGPGTPLDMTVGVSPTSPVPTAAAASD